MEYISKVHRLQSLAKYYNVLSIEINV